MPKRRTTNIPDAGEGRLVLPRRSRREEYIRQRREEAMRMGIPFDEEKAGEDFDRDDTIDALGGIGSDDDDVQMSDSESMAAQASDSEDDLEGICSSFDT